MARRSNLLVRTTDVKTAPAGDSYEAVVSFAKPANVDTVIADGRTLRAGGKLTAFDHGELVAGRPRRPADREAGFWERMAADEGLGQAEFARRSPT